MSGVLARAPAGIDEGIDLTPRGNSLDRQAEFLREYCARNPALGCSDGVVELYRKLRRFSRS
jgi:hypothetical protein